MSRIWLVSWVLAAGCDAMIAGPPVSLRVEPEAIDLRVDLAQPAPAAPLHVFLVHLDGTEEDVTAGASFELDGAPLGVVTGASLLSDGLTGGAATVRVTYDTSTAAIPATVHVHGRRIVDGTPAGAADAFAKASPMAFDAHLDPQDGAVIPSGLGRMVLGFAAPDLDDAHQIVVTAPYLDLAIVAPGAAGPRALELSPSEWGAITHTARGGAIQLEVSSLQTTAPATARVTTVGLEIADLDAGAVLAGAHWASPIAPARAGNRAPEPMVWIAVVSARPVGGNATSPRQLWLEAFYPERGVIAPAFHLPGQPATLQILHGPLALP